MWANGPGSNLINTVFCVIISGVKLAGQQDAARATYYKVAPPTTYDDLIISSGGSYKFQNIQ